MLQFVKAGSSLRRPVLLLVGTYKTGCKDTLFVHSTDDDDNETCDAVNLWCLFITVYVRGATFPFLYDFRCTCRVSFCRVLHILNEYVSNIIRRGLILVHLCMYSDK